LLKKLTFPVELTGTLTRLGTVHPGTQFKLDTVGMVPLPHAVRKLNPVVLVTVAFTTTPEIPVAGIPPAPVTWTARVVPAPRVDPAFA
jgi:hypothetical protein